MFFFGVFFVPLSSSSLLSAGFFSVFFAIGLLITFSVLAYVIVFAFVERPIIEKPIIEQPKIIENVIGENVQKQQEKQQFIKLNTQSRS